MKGVIEQLVVPNEEIISGSRREIELEREEALHPDTFENPDDADQAFSEVTKGLQLKYNKLNGDLMAYLRAHCLLFYPGEDICSVRVTVPTDLDYEILILKAYKGLLDRFKELNPGRFDPRDEEEIMVDSGCSFRRSMIVTYRLEQCRIMASQYSIINTLLMVLNQVKLIGLTYTYAVNQLCVGSREHLMNCLNMRKYLKQLFAPNEPLPSPSESSGSEEDEVAEAEEVRLGD